MVSRNVSLGHKTTEDREKVIAMGESFSVEAFG